MLVYLLEAGKNLGTVLPNPLYSNEESSFVAGVYRATDLRCRIAVVLDDIC